MNARGEDGDSPLHIACLYGQTAVVEECIKRGADINVRDEDDSTPLHDAAAGGFEAIVAQLLLKGASTSVKDNEEDTPIHHAARGGHAAVVTQLLTACSDRTALQHGQTCRPWQRPSSAPALPQGAPGGSASGPALPRREAGPLGAQPLPWLRELAASDVADVNPFDPPRRSFRWRMPRVSALSTWPRTTLCVRC